MAERSLTKPEIASQKRTIKLPPAIGDWTTYRPPKVLLKKIKTGLYGFDRLSREELNRVLFIHYRFIQEFFQRLKIDLSIGVEFISCQVEQTTYLNFLRTLSGAVAQGKLSVPSLHEGIQLFLDLNIANSIINHAVGSRDLEPLNRGLTEVENTILETAISEYLPLYSAAFEEIIEIPAFSMVSSPDVTLNPSISTSSTFVVFSAEAALNENVPGKIVFGYVGSTLKKLIAQYLEKDKIKPLNFSRLSAAALSKIKIPVAAVLGKTSLLTSELNLLETGDVVSLDTMISSAIELSLGDFLKLLAQPGIIHKKKAVRIAGFEEEEKLRLVPPLAIAEEKKAEAPAAEEEKVGEEKPAEQEAVEEELPEEEFPEEELSEEEFPEEEVFPEEEEFLEEEEFPEGETKEES